MKPFLRSSALLAAGMLGLVSARAQTDLRAAFDSVRSEDLMRHIKILASDEFEGRAPGSKGEELTVSYLTEQFKSMGLQPGNPNGTFTQDVPLAGITSQSSGSYEIGGQRADFSVPGECVLWSKRFAPESRVENSEMIFVGYGVVAPEYGWDDYKGVDVRGKTIVMLINDPAVPDPTDPAKLDDSMFKGRAMTYYGRWTYKFEVAAQKGAAAAIIVHETGPAGYPWIVVLGSNSRENFDLDSPDKNMGRIPVEGWVQLDLARKMCAAGGHDFDALKNAAARKDFKPVPLGGKASFTVKNTLRQVASKNVIAKREGSDPVLKNETIVYTAHWDHLGRSPSLEGDQIFNGALDNASGTAALLEIAEAFTQLKPKRSILFLAVTAEEKGLLGAKYYAAHPLYPLRSTLANINMDSMKTWGRARDIVVVGYGNSTLDDILGQAAARQQRVLRPDPEPEKGYFYRSDHIEFAKKGVPAIYTGAGVDYIGRPPEYGMEKRREYIDKDYHKVTDEIKPDWDLSGVVEDAQLFVETGWTVAQGDRYPEWKPGTEFKALREASLKEKSY